VERIRPRHLHNPSRRGARRSEVNCLPIMTYPSHYRAAPLRDALLLSFRAFCRFPIFPINYPAATARVSSTVSRILALSLSLSLSSAGYFVARREKREDRGYQRRKAEMIAGIPRKINIERRALSPRIFSRIFSPPSVPSSSPVRSDRLYFDGRTLAF